MIPRSRPSLRAADLLSTVLRAKATRIDFEKALAVQSAARFGLSFTYAHAGFFALLKAMHIQRSEIIIPAYTCRIMPEVIIATGNIPVFVDIDLADYNMNLDTLASAVTPATRVIVATHMFGYPADVQAIREIVDGKDVMLVEDAALMFPTCMRDLGGLQGDVGLFSFGPGKPLFTLRGGGVVTNDRELYEKVSAYRDEEMGDLPFKEYAKRWALLTFHYLRTKPLVYNLLQRLNLSKETVTKFMKSSVPGAQQSVADALPGDYDTRYANFQARIGLAQLHQSDGLISQHRTCAKLYAEALCEIPNLTLAPMIAGASYSLYTARVRERDERHFCQRMHAKGIDVGTTFNYALPNLSMCRPYAQGTYPYAEKTGNEVVNLPIYMGLTEEEVRYVAECITQILQ